MSNGDLLWTGWNLEPSIIFGCIGLIAVYAWWLKFRLTWRAILYVTGVAALFLSLASPIDIIGERYLFSVHMLQHLILIQVVPPLMLLGIPEEAALRALRVPLIGRAERALRQGPVAWILGVVTIWVWHLPVLYNTALTDLPLHVAQHLIFISTAMVFWWPILAPVRSRRMGLAGAVPYLFGAAAGSTLLGIILTFAKPGIYPAYLKPFDTLGILPLIRNDWGLTITLDQQLGGLIMWVPGSLIYLSCILVAFARWIQEPGEATAGAGIRDAGVRNA